ncbi:MAG: dynamin family protein [candidate division WOR-3 bacterium]
MLEAYREKAAQITEFIDSLREGLLPVLEEVKEATGVSIELADTINELKKRVEENKKVVLGVIGQIKSGKSTLLNAIIFDGEDVLPVAVSPQTARLTIIKHTEGKPGATVVFYTKEDWKQIKNEAKKERAPISEIISEERGEETPTEVSEEMFKRAEEEFEKERRRRGSKDTYSAMVEEAKKHLGNEIESLLGTKREVDWNELDKYVSAKGRFSSLVKYAELLYPHPMLVDLEIVDTPGLNDPVRSRENQTQKFLKDADAVIFLSSPKRFLDRSDLELALRSLKKACVSELILVPARLDELDEREYREFMEGIVPRVSQRARHAAEEWGWGTLAVNLAEKWFAPENTVPVSAMAFMLAKKKLGGRDEDFYSDLMRKNGWPVDNPEMLMERSGVEKLKKKIEEKIIARKHEILFAKPLSMLTVSVDEAVVQTERKLKETEDKLEKAKQGVEKLRNDLENKLKEFEEIKDSIYDALEGIEDTIQREFLDLEKDVRVHVEGPSEIHTPWLFKGSTEAELTTEIQWAAEEAFEEAMNSISRRCMDIKERIWETLEGIPLQSEQSRSIKKELSALVERLFAGLEKESFYTDKLSGGAENIARNDVERARWKAQRDVSDEIKERIRKARETMYKFIGRLERRLEEIYEERRVDIQKLERDLDKHERAKDEIQKRLERESSVCRKLWSALDEVKDKLADMKRVLNIEEV